MLIEAIYRKLSRKMLDTKLKNSVDSFWRPEVQEANGQAVECPWHGNFVTKYDFLKLFEQRGITGTIKEQLVAEAQEWYKYRERRSPSDGSQSDDSSSSTRQAAKRKTKRNATSKALVTPRGSIGSSNDSSSPTKSPRKLKKNNGKKSKEHKGDEEIEGLLNAGVYVYADGSEYKGAFDSDGLKTGYSRIQYFNQTSYTGEFRNGLRHGFGILTYNG